jgi:predicted RNA-binding protein with TRAM domain
MWQRAISSGRDSTVCLIPISEKQVQRNNMKKNDTFILKIEDMGIGGEGIGKYEGMTFFVKDAVIGDEILD